MAKAVQPRFPKFDRRLLGVWKSDRKRTFQEWSWEKNITLQKKRRLQSLFGKLEVTYTRNKIITTLRHRKWEQSGRYQIVATDETSVAIAKFGRIQVKNRRNYDPFCLKMAEEIFSPKPTIVHIHFDRKHYWISLGNGRNREFFRKIQDGK
jgi:hypothetical protein